MLLCLEFYLEEDEFYGDRELQDTILQLFKTVKWFRMVRAEQLVNGIIFQRYLAYVIVLLLIFSLQV